MTGRPEQVFLRGMLVAENGRFIGSRGCGHRIYAKPYAAAYKHYRPALWAQKYPYLFFNAL